MASLTTTGVHRQTRRIPCFARADLPWRLNSDLRKVPFCANRAKTVLFHETRRRVAMCVLHSFERSYLVNLLKIGRWKSKRRRHALAGHLPLPQNRAIDVELCCRGPTRRNARNVVSPISSGRTCKKRIEVYCCGRFAPTVCQVWRARPSSLSPPSNAGTVRPMYLSRLKSRPVQLLRRKNSRCQPCRPEQDRETSTANQTQWVEERRFVSRSAKRNLSTFCQSAREEGASQA